VVADHDVWRLNLELLPPQPSRTWAGSKRRRKKKSFNFVRQAVQKGPFSISELVHIRYLIHLLLSVTGNSHW